MRMLALDGDDRTLKRRHGGRRAELDALEARMRDGINAVLISAGVDTALHLAGRLAGKEPAREVPRGIQ